jgi:N-formylmaleamate deformylase
MNDWSDTDITVPHGTLHVYRRGAGRPLVLAHGATDNGRCWSRAADALADSFELIAYDARGHGRSTGTVEGRRSGEDLVAVVTSLDLEKPAAMGHSMGAGAVSEAITLRPDLFAAAVLEDPGWFSAPPPAQTAEPAGDRIKALTGWVESLQQMSLQEVIAQGRTQNPTWHDDELSDWAESKLQFHPGLGGLRGAMGSEWREQVRAYACPVLLLCGAPGRAIVSPETAAEAAELNALVSVVQLDAGHNIRREAYDGFIDAVRAFLGKHFS